MARVRTTLSLSRKKGMRAIQGPAPDETGRVRTLVKADQCLIATIRSLHLPFSSVSKEKKPAISVTYHQWDKMILKLEEGIDNQPPSIFKAFTL